MKQPRIDFCDDAVVVAQSLLGICLHYNNRAGIIVETEAYRAEGDPACHTFFRKSAREFVANHPPGSLYIYLNYGMHWMLNCLTVSNQYGAGFVLIRALQPRNGLDAMRSVRKVVAATALCSGPGKLTQALGINGSLHGKHFSQLQPERKFHSAQIIADPRIGISKAVDFPWRFTDSSASQWLSRKPRSPAFS